jgi:tRNA pseudouridine(38-40) synthase
MLCRRLAAQPCHVCAALQQRRHYDERRRSRRVEGKREMIDSLFAKRQQFATETSDARVDLKTYTSTSRPIAVATMEQDTSDAVESRQEQSALLPADDPEFSVLADDAFTYFPQEEATLDAVTPSAAPAGVRRYRVELQFKGDRFLGWNRAAEMRRRRQALAASQGETGSNVTWAGHSLDGVRSVKDAVDEALAVALDVAKVDVVASTPLETGVHAQRLTCHVDVAADVEMQPRTIMQRAQVWLREKHDPLAIVSMERAPQGFHARHSVRRRVYLYRILNRIAPPVFDAGQHWHIDRHLDVDAMASAAIAELVGERDFGSAADRRIARMVRRDGESATMRTLDDLRVVRQEDEVHLWFVGNSFLRHSLRYMVSALRLVGQGHWGEEDLRLFMSKGFDQRRAAERLRPELAPAQGLTLWNIEYPETFVSEAPRFVHAGHTEASSIRR